MTRDGRGRAGVVERREHADDRKSDVAMNDGLPDAASRSGSAGAGTGIAVGFVLAVAATLWTLAAPVRAALPPDAQRARELTEIISAAARVLALPIDAIERVADDRYRIRAGSCTLEAAIESTARREDPDGPVRFEVRLGAPTC